jgi:hypothetical protein
MGSQSWWHSQCLMTIIGGADMVEALKVLVADEAISS